jgi:hypothetical protein
MFKRGQWLKHRAVLFALWQCGAWWKHSAGLICCARERNLELPKLAAGTIILEPAGYFVWIHSCP